jgi:hypothetical protein
MWLSVNTNYEDEKQVEAFRSSDSKSLSNWHLLHIRGHAVAQLDSAPRYRHNIWFHVCGWKNGTKHKTNPRLFPLHPCGPYGVAPNIWTPLDMDSSSFPSHPSYELSPVNKPTSAASDNHNTMETELLFSGCISRTCKLNFAREHEQVSHFCLNFMVNRRARLNRRLESLEAGKGLEIV